MVGKIVNIISLFFFYAKFDFMWLTRDYKYLLAIMLSEFFILISEVTTVFLLAEKFGGIGQWHRNEIFFMLAYATIIGGIINSCFNNNFGTISRKIGRGQLDHFLIQPRPLWLIFCTEGFVPVSGSIGLLFGCVLMSYSIMNLPIDVSFFWLIMLAINIFASALIVLSICYGVGSIAFWWPRSAEEISNHVSMVFEQLRTFPLDTISQVLTTFFLVVVPVGLVAWFPSKMFLHPASGWQFFQVPLFAIIYMTISVYIFKKGLRHYEQFGSQRYVSYGHRG